MVRTAAAHFISLVESGVIHVTNPMDQPGSLDQQLMVALRKSVEDLVLTETKKQFSNLSHLPNNQAELVAGVDVETTRLQRGLSDWLTHAAYMPIDEEMIQIFCRNAETIVQAIDYLSWMGDDESLASYG